MSYIITKYIKGNPYLYQVRSERRDGKVVQVFEKYLGRDTTIKDNLNYNTLKSDIYKRDNGVCWICKKPVAQDEYELGHLVDRHNGGQVEYENLAVMHKLCNSIKPSHKTLEEHIEWLLDKRLPYRI